MWLFKAPRSLFHQLLLFLGLPLLVLWAFSAFSSYLSAMEAATQAYDRTLLASARTVAEKLVVRNGELQVDVPYVVFDTVELNMNDRLYYKVHNTHNQVISGYDDLPALPSDTPQTNLYPALAYFYHATYRDQAIRVALLYQPINENGVNGMAQIVVAETLQSRRYLAAQLLLTAMITQGILVFLTLLLAYILLKRLLKPMRQLSGIMLRRDPGVLLPLPDVLPWSETQPLIVAFNRYIERLRILVSRQERFTADASHQLRTPLAVLKTQASVALASDDPQQWRESLLAMRNTLDNTVLLTDRLLQLSRLKANEREGIRHREPVDLVMLAQQACFSRLLQARSKQIDLGYEGLDTPVMISGEPILLAELCANLLDNALKFTPECGVVTVRVWSREQKIGLEVEDSGPGIDPTQTSQALMPFHRLDNAASQQGAGIGLALVRDIARYHNTFPELLRGDRGGLLVRMVFDR